MFQCIALCDQTMGSNDDSIVIYCCIEGRCALIRTQLRYLTTALHTDPREPSTVRSMAVTYCSTHMHQTPSSTPPTRSMVSDSLTSKTDCDPSVCPQTQSATSHSMITSSSDTSLDTQRGNGYGDVLGWMSAFWGGRQGG